MHSLRTEGRWCVRLLAAVLLAVVMTSCRSARRPPPPPPPEVPPILPGLSRHDLAHDGRDRYVLLYRPDSTNAVAAMPLVLVFHAEGQTPEDIMTLTGFNTLADQHGFIVAYPSGTGSNPQRLTWNILLSGTYATANKVDDLGFVTKVVASVGDKMPVDTNAIYAAGFSQGGMLCYRLACDAEFSRTIAAIAPVAAVMTVPPAACEAVRPVPVISFHGRQDLFIRFEGGIGLKAPRNDRVARPGVPESIAFWVERGGLTGPPATAGGRGAAKVRHFGPGADGYEVISWEIEDGGHTWPGGNGHLPEWITGRVNRDINASSLIWQFFGRHRLADADAGTPPSPRE